ncbi:MAG: pre-60S factor rei1 [Marteilia pararefringens]
MSASSASPSAPPATSAFSCQTCKINLGNALQLRSHFRSDFHNFNSSLLVQNSQFYTKDVAFAAAAANRNSNHIEPLSFEEYENLMKAKEELDKKETQDSKQVFCDCCQKYSRNRAAFESHLRTKLHISNSQKMSQDMNPEEERETDEDLDAPANQEDFVITECTCLFCNLESASIAANFEHMKLAHAFMPQSPEYLKDRQGFYLFLASQVFAYSKCLSCGTEFANPELLQLHMRQKLHSNLDIYNEQNLGYIDFYEFPENDEMFLYRSKFEIKPDGSVLLPNGTLIFSKDAKRQNRSDLKYELFHNKQMQSRNQLEGGSSNDQSFALNSKFESSTGIERHKNEGETNSSQYAVVSYIKNKNSYYRMISADRDYLKAKLKNDSKRLTYKAYTFRMNVYRP